MPHPFLPRLLKGWLPPDTFFRQFGAPDSLRLRAALSCTHSLTRYLEEQTGKTVRVQLARQNTMPDSQHNARLWDMQEKHLPDGPLLDRSVWLLLAEQPCLYAYSQVAVNPLTPDAKTAIEQGEEPLGSLFLEREGPVERTDLELAEASIPELSHHLGLDTEQRYWCRRSLFCVNQNIRARIFEIFLPALLP